MQFASTEQQFLEFIKSEGSRYIGDDCAILPGGLLASCDALVEGVHFLLPDHRLEDVGFKALAVNLSDIAAMAGTPQFALLSISVPPDFSILSFKRLFRAMNQLAETYHTEIAGGDITRGPNLHVSVTILGKENPRGNWLRSAAHAGDVIIAGGDFGASAAGLWALCNNARSYKYCINKHKRPEPRIKEALQLASLAQQRCGALIDASDGLADALTQISLSSSPFFPHPCPDQMLTNTIGMEIKEDLIPMHEEMRAAARQAGVDPLHWALYGGEDYELVGCVSPHDWKSIAAASTYFTKIGTVSSTAGIFVEKSNGERFAADMSKTFQHFPAFK